MGTKDVEFCFHCKVIENDKEKKYGEISDYDRGRMDAILECREIVHDFSSEILAKHQKKMLRCSLIIKLDKLMDDMLEKFNDLN